MQHLPLIVVTYLLLFSGADANIKTSQQVLVTIDDAAITRGHLQKALTSSPFYTQFNTLNENIQASIRGDLLKRMVSSRLLAAESKRLKLDETSEFKTEMKHYADGLLYRQYTNSLKDNIELSDDKIQALRKDYKNNQGSNNNYTAAKSAAKAEKYKALLKLTLLKLRESRHVKLYEEKIKPGIKPDTVLMEGDDGLKITYADIVDSEQYPNLPDIEAIQKKLYQQTEYLLILSAAKSEKIDIAAPLERYKQQLLPSILSSKKAKEWLNENADILLNDYYLAHPKLSVIGEQWHIGQIVLKTRKEAESVQQQIKSGSDTLFQLAGKLSIDPYGKAHNGDMGWVAQGSGQPQIEKALKTLKDNELSDIVKTPQGFHLITILTRKAGQKLGFSAIKDKIKQRFLAEKMQAYLQQLQSKHQITWHVLETNETKAKKLAKRKAITE